MLYNMYVYDIRASIKDKFIYVYMYATLRIIPACFMSPDGSAHDGTLSFFTKQSNRKELSIGVESTA